MTSAPESRTSDAPRRPALGDPVLMRWRKWDGGPHWLHECVFLGSDEHGDWIGVPVGTIKRHATGKGNADKAAMVAAVRARGFSPADDNEADAIAILLWALETRGGVQ